MIIYRHEWWGLFIYLLCGLVIYLLSAGKVVLFINSVTSLQATKYAQVVCQPLRSALTIVRRLLRKNTVIKVSECYRKRRNIHGHGACTKVAALFFSDPFRTGYIPGYCVHAWRCTEKKWKPHLLSPSSHGNRTVTTRESIAQTVEPLKWVQVSVVVCVWCVSRRCYYKYC